MEKVGNIPSNGVAGGAVAIALQVALFVTVLAVITGIFAG
jgi:hypothetical protein